MHTPQKLAYIKPELVEVGSFEEVTLGASTGVLLDAPLPVGANPLEDSTFLS